MQSSPFASYPLGSLPPQGAPGGSNYPGQQQYGARPSGYPQANYGGPSGGGSFDANAQMNAQAILMHQKQQQLAQQQLGGAAANLHPSQLAQMMQYQQQQQQGGAGGAAGGGSPATGYGNHQQMYPQPTPPQQQHHQQSHHQSSHHASSSHAREQSGGGDHHRKSSRRSKGNGPNPALFSIPVESEAEQIGDDLDGVTERTQAIERYKLNHDLLGQLFNPLPISKHPDSSPPTERLYSISDLEARLAELEESNARLPDELSSKMDEVRQGFQSAASRAA